MGKLLLSVLLGGALLCCLVQLAENKNILFARSNGDGSGSDMGNSDNDIARIADNMFDRLLNHSRSTLLQSLKNISSYLPVNVEYSVTVAKNCNIVKYNRPFYFKIPLIIAAVLIILGIVFGFFGYRLIKVVLFLIGFLAGFTIVYFIIVGFTHGRSENWLPYVALAVAVVVGVIIGLLTICIYYVGIFLAGASIGFLVPWFILGAINVPFLRDHIYVPIVICVVVAIIVGILALLVQKWFFIVGTAILGAFIITWGVDYYIELGSMVYYLLLFAENRSTLKPCWYSWVMLPVFFILALAGFLIQAFVTGRKYDHKKEMKGVCCGLCSKKKKKSKDDMEMKKKDPRGGSQKYTKLKSEEH